MAIGGIGNAAKKLADKIKQDAEAAKAQAANQRPGASDTQTVIDPATGQPVSASQAGYSSGAPQSPYAFGLNPNTQPDPEKAALRGSTWLSAEESAAYDAQLAKLQGAVQSGQIDNQTYMQLVYDLKSRYGSWGSDEERRAFENGIQYFKDQERDAYAWDKSKEFAGQLDPFAERTPEEQAAYEKSIGIINPDDLARFGEGERQRDVTGKELIAGVDLGDSAWQGGQSAYASGETGAGLMDAARFFTGVRDGAYDAEAEALWRGRMGDAEAAARAQREADLQQLETRGFGGGGGAELLSNLGASQGLVTTGAQASLDAAAMQQARKDEAAMNAADTYAGIASGQDAFTGNQNSALDWWGTQQGQFDQNAQTYNADVYGRVGDQNWDRYWGNQDANTNLLNDTTAYNAGQNAWGTGMYGEALGAGTGYAATSADLGQGKTGMNLGENARQAGEKEDPWDYVDRGLSAVGATAGLFGRRK